MLGMLVGEERSIVQKIPDTWEPASLRGVEVRCEIRLNELFEWELPEVCLLLSASPRSSQA